MEKGAPGLEGGGAEMEQTLRENHRSSAEASELQAETCRLTGTFSWSAELDKKSVIVPSWPVCYKPDFLTAVLLPGFYNVSNFAV